MRTVHVVLLFLLTVISTSAWAEWVKIGTGDDGITHYFDPNTIRKTGNLHKVWTVQDLKERDPMGAMSRRLLYEFDCKGERSRPLSGTAHSEPMLKGRIIAKNDDAGDWSFIPPETSGSATYGIVCGK